MEETITIRVKQDLWKYLHDHKTSSKDTFEDIIWRFIMDDDLNKEVSKDEKSN